MTVGERIKERRLQLQMSQEELAKRCGYKSRSSINKIELARDLPLNKVEKMAAILGCTPAYLMGWEDETDEATYNRFPDEAIVADFIFDKLKNKYIRKLYDVLGDITEEEGEELIRYAEFMASKRKEKDN